MLRNKVEWIILRIIKEIRAQFYVCVTVVMFYYARYYRRDFLESGNRRFESANV